MIILTILPLVFCPIEADTLVWTVSEEWLTANDMDSIGHWDLDAPNSGTYIAVLKAISTGLSEESPAAKKILRHGLIQVN